MATAAELKTRVISDTEIEMTREFDAPRDLVFKVMLDPQLIPQWWGPRSVTTVVHEMDVRVGGTWRFSHKESDGSDTRFHGEYLELTPPSRIKQTFVWEGAPDAVMTDDMTLEDLAGGRTLVRVRSSSNDPEAVKGMIESGMEQGAKETYDRLAELLASQQKKAAR